MFEQPISFVAQKLKQDEERAALFLCACFYGKVGFVRSLLAGNECNLKQLQKITCLGGLNALHLAIIEGNVECVEVLLSKSPKMWLNSTYNGYLPLHMAIFYLNPAIISQILKSLKTNSDNLKIEINKKSKNNPNYSALHIAALKNLPHAITQLLENGADIDATLSNTLHTPLHIAALCKNEKTSEVLLHKGASLKALMTNGMVALQLVTSNVPRALEHILDSGVYLEYAGDHQTLVMNFTNLQQFSHDCSHNLLDWFVENGQHQFLHHPLCKVLLEENWDRLKMMYYYRLVFACNLLILVTAYFLAFHTCGCTIDGLVFKDLKKMQL
jgi:ankyrin repeat protein